MAYKTWKTFLDQMNESEDTVVLDLTKEKTSWQDKRINAINRKISRVANKQAMTEKYIDEHWKICNSQANNKRGYKDECKKETC
jgi:predicted  nucleic acid-binding Zn-ribbon protein